MSLATRPKCTWHVVPSNGIWEPRISLEFSKLLKGTQGTKMKKGEDRDKREEGAAKDEVKDHQTCFSHHQTYI